MEFIFDRTNYDLVNDTDKAYISYIDLNRIEQATKEIAELLRVDIVTKEWSMTEFRTVTEMKRIHDNIELLMKSYHSNPLSPSLPKEFTFTSIYQANDIEECLYRIKEIFDSVSTGVARLSFRLGTKPLGNRKG